MIAARIAKEGLGVAWKY